MSTEKSELLLFVRAEKTKVATVKELGKELRAQLTSLGLQAPGSMYVDEVDEAYINGYEDALNAILEEVDL